ncbi:MAG TPA: alpha/beta hydrolase-fold protein, partial [Pirellulales bacterium]
DPQKQVLFGHSFGGLFVLHVLFAHPESYQHYIASSPSIWWADGAVLREEKEFTERLQTKTVNARVHISIGEFEETFPPDMPAERRAVYLERRQAGNARELAERLARLSERGVEATFRVFAEEDHGSAAGPALSRGVRLALEQGGPPRAN